MNGNLNTEAQATESQPVTVPKSKYELSKLLLKYAGYLKETKTARESFDKSIANHEQDPKSRFIDPTKDKKLEIEAIFYNLTQNYDRFSQSQKELDKDLAKTVKNSEDENLDFNLFSKQISSLQLLSRDLDLPELLQEDLLLSIDEVDNDVNVSDEIFTEIFKESKESGNFVEKLKNLGVDLSDSSLENLGNYYTEQTISNKISSRIQDLENLPLNLGTFKFGEDEQKNYDELKVQSLIELKALKVLAKQKQLKKYIMNFQINDESIRNEHLKDNLLINQIVRTYSVRPKIELPKPENLAVKLEERRKQELEKQNHALHLNKISKQLEILNDVIISDRTAKYNKRQKFIKDINSFHAVIEKDESKKLEKNAKQRLQALKANDEEAYMKLLDETKDHRITHLLKQTNLFLDSLAQAVKVQQVESGADIPLEEGTETGNLEDQDDLREKIDYYQVAHRIKEEITEQPSILVGGQLKEYQIKGLQWMVSLYNNKLNGILADEMGLGKTIQSISLITYLIEKKHEDKFLVIVPLSTITNWTMEFEKWAPTVRTIVYKGSQNQRREMQAEIRLGNFQVMLTTYEYIIRERPLLCRFDYSHMIIDEGHRMKNSESKLSVTLRTYYKTRNRLILTGTPLQNNLPELWALLNFVLPKIFNSVKSFDEWFNTPFANTGSQEKIELTEEESLLVIRRLHKVLRPFLLRRLKKDVEKDLPDKVEKVLKCNLSGLQYILYNQMLKHNALFVGAEVGSTKSGIKGLNNKIMQLRKICNHPFVFEEVEAVLDSSKLTNDLIWRVSGKFELLDRILPKFEATGHRVLMFFQMTQVMDIMEDFLRWREMKYLRLDGSTKAEDRQDMLKVFNAPNSEYFCFLLSTRAGGLGLNLQTADTVIIFDTDWNPHQDLQAQDRAHRIGQKNEVRILRLITNDSVEEVILERAHQKLDIDGKVIQAGKFDNKSTAEEQEEFLKKLLEAEASKEDSEEKNMLDDEEMNEILARSDDEKIVFAKMDKERAEQDRLAGISNRIISESELPPVFREDVTHHFEKDTKELSKKRVKKRVKYDDGLTEEQWLMAMDDDNDTVEDAIRRKEQRAAKRRRTRAAREGKTIEEIELDEAENGILEEEDEDDEEEEEEEPVNGNGKRSRRSATPNFQEEEEEDDVDAMEEDDPTITEGQEIIQGINALRGDDDHDVSEVFQKLPPRKLYPDYYKIIKNPLSINSISNKLLKFKYGSIDELKQDLLTMCANAKTYNEEGSWIFEDATKIETYIESL